MLDSLHEAEVDIDQCSPSRGLKSQIKRIGKSRFSPAAQDGSADTGLTANLRAYSEWSARRQTADVLIAVTT